MAASARGYRPYITIWCEHHEDFLAECPNNVFDGYQIKSSRPENGAWQMNDPELVKSIRRFVALVRKFQEKIGKLFFVTNTDFDTCGDTAKEEKRRRLRPREFLAHVNACTCHEEVAPPYLKTFNDLQASCGCVAQELFVVLQRLELVRGPDRDSFHTVIAHEHLSAVPGCENMTPAELNKWCNDLIAIVCACSSLVINDPARHLESLIAGPGLTPAMAAKRLRPAEHMTCPTNRVAPFEFSGPPTIDFGEVRDPAILSAKLKGGALEDQVEYLSQRERDTERHLLGEITRKPENADRLLRRLQEVVGGECSEAHLRARLAGLPYGPRMMIDVQERLRRISREEPDRVAHQSYDCLIGMVALLTSACRVWWCPESAIQEPAA